MLKHRINQRGAVALAAAPFALVCLIALGLLAGGAASAESVGDAVPVRVVVNSPQDGETIRSRTDMAPLRGVATAGERPSSFDVILVVDVSGSTAYPSGLDIDADGTIGETKRALLSALPDTKNTDPDDSILAAEVAAGKSMLEGLDPNRVHVGVLSFSGEIDPSTGRRRGISEDALLEQSLTGNFDLVRQSLEAVLLRGPHGGTNMEAGVKLALRELAGLSGAVSAPRAHAKKIVLFLTDGKPSLPFGLANQEDPDDTEAAIASARLAKAAGITMNVYGMGPFAIDYPVAVTEMARVTNGLYTPVRQPGDIIAMLTSIYFANVEAVVAVNLTLRESSGPDDILVHPDGSFRGYVPVRPGLNRIRVSALASDGTRGSTELDILFKHQGLTDAEQRAELERIRNRNREIQLRLERDRQKAFRKQERERALEIEIEDDGEGKKP